MQNDKRPKMKDLNAAPKLIYIVYHVSCLECKDSGNNGWRKAMGKMPWP